MHGKLSRRVARGRNQVGGLEIERRHTREQHVTLDMIISWYNQVVNFLFSRTSRRLGHPGVTPVIILYRVLAWMVQFVT